ncbi:MAG: hypothetical protein BM555_02575 [Crocinitomix sp. MedPE-SWsnd]|jgi:periplasmic protein CpxP/Spy|nr:MAG: hypothetical protein BM555_02575 [Crocinitomix sp. MedPE-SWsnd]
MQKLKNNTMKKLGIITLVIGLASMTSFAQEDGRIEKTEKKEREKLTPVERAEKRTKHMTKTLSLTEVQVAKVSEINLAHAKEMEKLHVEMKALKEKLKSEKESTRSKVDAVLTADQKLIVEQKKEERKEKKAERRKDCCKE